MFGGRAVGSAAQQIPSKPTEEQLHSGSDIIMKPDGPDLKVVPNLVRKLFSYLSSSYLHLQHDRTPRTHAKIAWQLPLYWGCVRRLLSRTRESHTVRLRLVCQKGKPMVVRQPE